MEVVELRMTPVAEQRRKPGVVEAGLQTMLAEAEELRTRLVEVRRMMQEERPETIQRQRRPDDTGYPSHRIPGRSDRKPFVACRTNTCRPKIPRSG